jgi:hypothetical protein
MIIQKKYELKRLKETGIIRKSIDESRFVINYKNELNFPQYEAAQQLMELTDNCRRRYCKQEPCLQCCKISELGYDPNPSCF